MVLIHFNSLILTLSSPPPVMIGVWSYPARPIALKQPGPSDITWDPGVIWWAVHASTTIKETDRTREKRIFSVCPSSLVATAAINGILSVAPRPRLPSRNLMTRWSLWFMSRAVLLVHPQCPWHTERRSADFGLSYQIDTKETGCNGQFDGSKDGPGSQRCLGVAHCSSVQYRWKNPVNLLELRMLTFFVIQRCYIPRRGFINFCDQPQPQ